MQRQRDEMGLFVAISVAETALTREFGRHVFEIAAVLRVSNNQYNFRVCVVETAEIELAAHHAVIETSLLLSQEREFSGQRRRAGIGLFAQNPN